MLHYIILYLIVLYYIILYYFILYYIILFYIILFHLSILNFTGFYYHLYSTRLNLPDIICNLALRSMSSVCHQCAVTEMYHDWHVVHNLWLTWNWPFILSFGPVVSFLLLEGKMYKKYPLRLLRLTTALNCLLASKYFPPKCICSSFCIRSTRLYFRIFSR